MHSTTQYTAQHTHRRVAAIRLDHTVKQRREHRRQHTRRCHRRSCPRQTGSRPALPTATHTRAHTATTTISTQHDTGPLSAALKLTHPKRDAARRHLVLQLIKQLACQELRQQRLRARREHRKRPDARTPSKQQSPQLKATHITTCQRCCHNLHKQPIHNTTSAHTTHKHKHTHHYHNHTQYPQKAFSCEAQRGLCPAHTSTSHTNYSNKHEADHARRLKLALLLDQRLHTVDHRLHQLHLRLAQPLLV
jgi:hypothetical protein